MNRAELLAAAMKLLRRYRGTTPTWHQPVGANEEAKAILTAYAALPEEKGEELSRLIARWKGVEADAFAAQDIRNSFGSCAFELERALKEQSK